MTELSRFGPACRAWLDERPDLAATTLASYREHVASFGRHVGPDFPVRDLMPAHFTEWLRSMDCADSTRNTRMATLRSFMAWASEPGPFQIIAWDPTRRVRRYRVQQGPPPVINRDDLARVLELAPGRDRVMMVLLVQTTIRRAELASARIEDYDLARARLRVTGKGTKTRWVEVPAEAQAEIGAWLAVLGRRSGPLFPSSHRPGHGLAPGTISHIVAAAGRRCGVHLWPHLLRHQGLTDAAEQGATAWELQRQAGHAYSSTTDRYIHVADGSVARAMAGRRYRGRSTAGPITSRAIPSA